MYNKEHINIIKLVGNNLIMALHYESAAFLFEDVDDVVTNMERCTFFVQ